MAQMGESGSSGAHAVPQNIGLAIALMVTAVSCFSLIDVTAKLLIGDISVYQILWVRFVVFVALFGLYVPPWRWPALVAGPRLGLLVLRGGIPIFAAGAFFVALKSMELADATAIFFASPFFLTALSVPLLGERVGLHRWFAVILGFSGVLIVIQPGAGAFGLIGFLPLGAALFYSLFQLMTRYLAGQVQPQATLFFTGMVGMVVTAVPAIIFWVWPSPLQWALLVAGGAVNICIHFLLIQAFARAPAPVLSPFNYMQIFAAVILGYLVFGDIPGLTTFIGVAFIVAAGLYMVRRERLGQSGERANT